MTEIQQKIFDMFKWFHEFCVKNDIKYYAIAGTALGALRHSGFIPWDDDIDVGLPRSEYDKLISLMDGKKFGKYVIEKPFDNKDFTYGFAKIYDTTTTLIEHTRYNTKRGVYIDVFPLDGAGDNYENALESYRKVQKKRNWILIKTCAIRKGRKFYKNLSVVLGKLLPFSWRKKAIKLDKICREKTYEESAFVANYYGAWGPTREMCKKDYFGTPKLYKFEDGEMYLPEDADKYLTTMYGDYMTPPPPEKQVTHHDFVSCDLTKSYLYKKDQKMLALILNSGLGSRMGAYTKEHPKCMTNITDDQTILSRQLNLLSQQGISQVIMTTGYYNDVLIDYCKQLNLPLDYKFVHNPIYDQTNYIYSIYCAREELKNSNVIMMHGDLVFEEKVLQQVVQSELSCMTTSSTLPLPEKDFKAVIEGNRIKKVGIEFFESAVCAQPLYKLNAQDWNIWLDKIIEFCESEDRKCYAENAFNQVSESCAIYALDVCDALCAEIDNPEDLEVVSKKVKNLSK